MPDVGTLLKLMDDWRQSHPNYHALVETKGKELLNRSEVYRFVDEQGAWSSRIKNEMSKPVKLNFVVEGDKDHLRAYFPRLNQVVEMATQAEIEKSLAEMGWTGGEVKPDLLLKMARTSFVEAGTNFTALTMVFPGAMFRLPPVAKELFLTIKVAADGQPLEMEQLTLGLRVVSSITYLTNDVAQWKAAAPAIPPNAARAAKSFQEALQEEIVSAVNKPKLRI